MVSLPLYLEQAIRCRNDCCTFMANWLVENGLPDPMMDRRDTYSTRREYQRLLSLEGGLLASCEQRFATIGLRVTSSPRAGDIAVVVAPLTIKKGRAVFGKTGAICVGSQMRAVVASDTALAVAALQTIRAWTFDG